MVTYTYLIRLQEIISGAVIMDANDHCCKCDIPVTPPGVSTPAMPPNCCRTLLCELTCDNPHTTCINALHVSSNYVLYCSSWLSLVCHTMKIRIFKQIEKEMLIGFTPCFQIAYTTPVFSKLNITHNLKPVKMFWQFYSI